MQDERLLAACRPGSSRGDCAAPQNEDITFVVVQIKQRLLLFLSDLALALQCILRVSSTGIARQLYRKAKEQGSGVCCQTIADARLGEQQFGIGGVFFQFFS